MKCQILVVLLFVVVLGCRRDQTKDTTAVATQSEKPSETQVQQPTSKESYDSSHDRIWSSMVPGKTYIRDSPSEPGTVEFLQRYDDACITVPAPAAGTIVSSRNEKGYTALSFSDEKGKLYHYRFSMVVVKMGQKVIKGEMLGDRPGVVRLPFTIIAPGGVPIDPRPFFPPVKELPPDADKF